MKRTFDLLISVCFLISITVLNNCNKEEEKKLPALITLSVSDITTMTAVLGGFITDDGGADVIARGVCWGTAINPTISGTKTNDGTGIGPFTSSLKGLNQNTLYFARAYATNSEGTAYGNEVQFTTSQAETPTVVTMVDFRDISYYSTSVGINITNDGGTPVTEKGICWATSENPTINNDKEINYETDTGLGGYFWCVMAPLQPKSVYHVRAYAINCVGISYGNDVLITTLAVPEVTTFDATEITSSSATVGGNVISLGDASNVEIGICYGTEKDPTINGPHVKASITSTGEFTCNLTILRQGTLYYARAYVYWTVYDYYEYAVYGNEVTFTTH